MKRLRTLVYVCVLILGLCAMAVYAATSQAADLTNITGGPNANGYAIATAFNPVWNGTRTHYVAFSDRHIHEPVSIQWHLARCGSDSDHTRTQCLWVR